MKDARVEAIAAAHRVSDRARELAQDLADGYRRSTRAFKLKAAVVGSWALLSVLTLWLTCPGGGNRLGAEVHISYEDPLQTNILILNTSSSIWKDVVVTLDGAWRYEQKTVRDGEKIVVATHQFTQDGASAPGDLKPRTLTIACDRGRATVQLQGR